MAVTHKQKLRVRTAEVREGKNRYTLAFETSCDETCAAVVDESLRVLSNVVSSQIEIHKLYGGVVPEIASRNHAMAIQTVYEEALQRACVELRDILNLPVTPKKIECFDVSHMGGEGVVASMVVFVDGVA